VKCYKGFNNKLQCTPGNKAFQFEIGKTYEEPKADLCKNGFHACENPLDVFAYYPPADSRYCEVELDEVSNEKSDDSKRCGKKITIGDEIGLKGIIEAGVKFIFDRVDWKNAKESNTGYRSASTNTGDQSVATNTGYQSASTNTGYRSVSTNTGDQSVATNTGDRSVSTNTGNWSVSTNTGNWSASTNTGDQSVATNTGNWSVSTNTGNRSASTNTGDQSVATNTGDRSVSTNTGDQSVATNTGYQSVAIVSGTEGVAVSLGYQSKAKGAKGCWIVLSEWDENAEHIKTVKSYKVDGRRIKANTFYRLDGGKPVECE
jgi:hypothetical protein